MRRIKVVGLAGVGSFILIGVIAAGFTFSTSLISACGCGSINGWVLGDLKALDARIKDYASLHSGLFPSYDEVLGLYQTVDPSPYAPAMKGQIDVFSGDLTFTPSDKAIVYAVSADRHTYILRGVGVSEKYVHLYFFGRDLGDHRSGLVYPILNPSDPLPNN